MVRATTWIKRSDTRRFAWWLGLTLVLGVTFLGLQALLWKSAWGSGLQLGSGVLGSVFYGLTLFHAAHIVGGLLALVYLLVRARGGVYDGRRSVPVQLVGMFWHFVDVVWISMFLAIFVF